MNKQIILLFAFATISFSANASKEDMYALLRQEVAATVEGKSFAQIRIARPAFDAQLAITVRDSGITLTSPDKSSCLFILSRLHCATMLGGLPNTYTAIENLGL